MINPDKIFGRLGNRMFQGAYLYAQMKRGNIPDIWLQDPKYFEGFEEDIKKIYGDDIGFIPDVSVHIRRGDYVDNPNYVDLTKTDYYKKAMELFPNDRFLIFSDDIEFAKEYFKDSKYNLVFIEEPDHITSFNLMASCKANIIANSSFSWWAAYVNPNPAKVVVAPKNWFPEGSFNKIGIPNEWKRL